MADHLMLAQAIAVAVALVFSAGSAAQALTDPTRPPLELMDAAAAVAAPHTPLQSILLSGARKGAIINGQYVPLGGTYGKARLIEITATGVTLKSDQGLEMLQLYPSAGKTAPASGVGGKPEKMVKRP